MMKCDREDVARIEAYKRARRLGKINRALCRDALKSDKPSDDESRDDDTSTSDLSTSDESDHDEPKYDDVEREATNDQILKDAQNEDTMLHEDLDLSGGLTETEIEKDVSDKLLKGMKASQLIPPEVAQEPKTTQAQVDVLLQLESTQAKSNSLSH
jgi:hypothetical protein